MTSELRSRLALLVILAVLGVGLAVIGTTVGATNPLFSSNQDAAFVVSEDNISFEHGDQQTTVINNMTQVESVEIKQQNDGAYQVNTETDTPLTDNERSQAKTTARNNATVRRALHELDRYNMSVEPIHKLSVDSAQSMNTTSLNTTATTGKSTDKPETFIISVEDSNETDTVTVDRTPEYVEHEVIVRIRDSVTDELYYSVRIDLEAETVVDITE